MCLAPETPGVLRLRATLQAHGPAAAIALTDEQLAHLGGGRKTPPVTVTVDGTRTVRGRVGRMGGNTLIGFSKALRAEARVEVGGTYDVVIAVDDAPREVALPPALAAALDGDPRRRAAWDALAPSRRKEHARQIAEAKQAATRERRLVAVLAALDG